MTDIKFSLTEFFAEVLENPGKIHERFRAFHAYSLGNQWLAMLQLPSMEPIATYKQWQAMGRQVKKGAKAIALRMPVVFKDKEDETKTVSAFLMKKNWFGLSSTEGEDYTPAPVPAWDKDAALKALGIKEVPFEFCDGNVLGYALPKARKVAVSPLAFDYHKTLFHELGHVLMHDGSEQEAFHGAVLPRHVKEFEAEACAYLVASALGLNENLEYSRGYLQSWLKGDKASDIKEEHLRRALGAADKILKAGKPNT